MFESAEIGHAIDKDSYRQQVPVLREALLDVQYDLKEKADFPVLILIHGFDGAGRGETMNLINEWLDPRLIDTVAFSTANDEERARPWMWRYWQKLPAKGRIGMFFGSYYSDALFDRVYEQIDHDAFDREIFDIMRLERMISQDGALILKFWFHLTKDKQRKRLKELEKDPATRWRVTADDKANMERYDTIRKYGEHMIRLTNTAYAPWIVVDGEDANFRSLTVGQTILKAIRNRMSQNGHVVDASEGRLNSLTRDERFRNHSLVLAFEGNDAAGKGGTIRRITQALDARSYRVIPVAAPTEEERAKPWLWRFWRRVPGKGGITIFDRTWYGRVLVERVEGFAREPDWMRAYYEINDFEHQLCENGAVVLKFWLAISNEEQMARFKLREETGFKRFKITEEDWRNREKWDAYKLAVSDMVDRTSTSKVPWTLVEANNKYYARIKVLSTICNALEARLGA